MLCSLHGGTYDWKEIADCPITILSMKLSLPFWSSKTGLWLSRSCLFVYAFPLNLFCHSFHVITMYFCFQTLSYIYPAEILLSVFKKNWPPWKQCAIDMWRESRKEKCSYVALTIFTNGLFAVYIYFERKYVFLRKRLSHESCPSHGSLLDPGYWIPKP